MRFRIGQRVRMTQRALKQGLGGRAKRTNGQVLGTVVGHGHILSVRVKRDGLKTVSSYFVGFWRAV